MGLVSYFKPKGKKEEVPAPAPAAVDVAVPHGAVGFDDALADQMNNLKCDIMADYLHQQQQQRRWISNEADEGVVLKKSKHSYSCCPSTLANNDAGFMKAIEMLNVRVSFHSIKRR